MTTRFQQITLAIEQAQHLSASAPPVTPEPVNTGWMPFNLFDFAALLIEAIPLIPDTGRLLEVGAGPGPNLAIARDLFGMDVHGIEVHDALAAVGRDAGLPIQTADAADWTGYEKFDAVWLNRPIRDADAERLLEERIWHEMADGAVAICANLETRPPESWFIVNDSWESLRRGAWVKPRTRVLGGVTVDYA
jgi:hypothetical protein